MSKTPKDIEKETLIYTLSDPDTGIIRYVGKTVKSLKARLTDHLYLKRKEVNHRINWIKSIVKKGKKPIITQIDSCKWNESQEREQYWIKYYKDLGFNLVNGTEGGEGNLGLKYSKKRLKNHIKKMRENSKKVYQYNLEGFLIKEWINAKIAAEKLNLKYCNIVQVCIGDKKSHGNFIWSYNKENKLNSYNFKYQNRKSVKIINIKTKEEFIFESITDACIFTNTFTSNAVKCLKGIYKKTGGYKFEYIK